MPKKKPSRLSVNTNRILSISAMAISLGTLIVILYQTNLLSQQTDLIRREQHISVMPYLEFEVVRPSDNWTEFKILNTGLGPARIEEVHVHSGDSSLPVDISTYFLKNYDQPSKFSVNYLNPGIMIMAGAEIALLGTDSQNESFNLFLKDLGESITFDVVYSSVYGDKWIWKSANGIPEKYVGEE